MKKLFTLLFMASTTAYFGQWAAKAVIPAATAQEGLVAHPNGNIYLFDGYAATFPYTSITNLYIYNIAANTWTTGANSPFAERSVGYCLGDDNKIYAFGGSGGGMQGFNAFARYDVATDTWSTLATPGNGCWGGAIACYNNKIYYAGGETFENLMRIYDIATGTWSNGANLLTGVKQHKMVSANNGYLYVFGGLDASNTGVNLVQCYDIANNSWSIMSTIPVQKNSFGACLAPDGRIYLVCGKNAYGNNAGPFFDDVNIFNPCDTTWSSGPLHPTAHGELAVTSTTAGVWAMGGSNGAGLDINYFLPVAQASLGFPTVTANNGMICAGKSFTIVPGGAVSYTFSGGSAIVSPTTSTTYTVIGKGSSGCVNKAISTVSVNAAPSVMGATNNSLICAGASATLSGSGAVTYTWNTNANTASIVVTPSATTSYTLTGTGSNGCEGTAVITQTVSVCTGITSITGTLDVKLYPNPGTGLLHVELASLSDSRSVELYDVTGRLILSKQINGLGADIHFEQAPAGIYMIRLTENGEHVFSSKIIKH